MPIKDDKIRLTISINKETYSLVDDVSRIMKTTKSETIEMIILAYHGVVNAVAQESKSQD